MTNVMMQTFGLEMQIHSEVQASHNLARSQLECEFNGKQPI